MGRNCPDGVELLAPAGSFDAARAAVNAGADAVYMGGRRFGARAYAQSAEDGAEDELLKALDYCHRFGVKLYMTVNTLFKDDELKELFAYMKPYYEAGVDAAIVQDLGAARLLRTCFPDLELHASTQMTVTGPDGARLARQLGMSRVVLARELGMDEIRAVWEETGIEIEAFVHGAMCYSYSGACFMSSLLGGRSGNRGRCAGTCRLCYELHGKKGCFLSMKDMCTLQFLPELMRSGVYSMKIEGRMKPPVYTAGVVSVYRKYLDLARRDPAGYRVDPADVRLLQTLFDRGGMSSYLDRHNGRDMIALQEKRGDRGGARRADFAAEARRREEATAAISAAYIDRDRQVSLDGCVRLNAGEPAVLTLSGAAGADSPDFSVTVRSEQCLEPASGHPASRADVEKQLRKTGGTGFALNRLEISLGENLFVPVKLLNELRRRGLAACEEALLGKYRRTYSPQIAENEVPVDSAGTVRDGKYGRFVCEPLETLANPAGAARAGAAGGQGQPELRVSVELEAQFVEALAEPRVRLIYLDEACFSEAELRAGIRRCHEAGKRAGIRLRRIARALKPADAQRLTALLLEAGADAVLVRAFEQLGWARDILERCKKSAKHLELVCDYTIYAYNQTAASCLAMLGADRLTAPIELNCRELGALMKTPQRPFELLAYGHLPMMVSANCLVKTGTGCTHRNDIVQLKDRMGKRMPVRCYCRYCYNRIFNADPLVLFDQQRELSALQPASLRYDFSVENGAQTREVLAGAVPAQLTRGHFRRGVE